jgi:UDP-glucose 4-epimerase
VTGGAGFIGSHVVDAYVRSGHRVTVLDDLSTGKQKNLNPRVRFFKADILSSRVAEVFQKGRFDVVNHHAAQIDVRRSVADPELDARINILGLVRLLELSRRFKVKKFIFAASGGTYYGECTRPAHEELPPRPLSPYGVAKLSGEHYLRAFGALHGLRHTTLRYGNVYGPRQDPHGEAGVVAIFGLRMLSGEPVSIFGDGRQQRDYVFAGDVAAANLAALRRGDNDAFNIGTARATSVNELFRVIKRITGYDNAPVRKPKRLGELQRSVLDIRKARKHLGWRPETSLVDGLRKTIESFRHVGA